MEDALTVRLRPGQLAGLKALERYTGARPADQIRRAIDDWLDKHGSSLKKGKEA